MQLSLQGIFHLCYAVFSHIFHVLSLPPIFCLLPCLVVTVVVSSLCSTDPTVSSCRLTCAATFSNCLTVCIVCASVGAAISCSLRRAPCPVSRQQYGRYSSLWLHQTHSPLIDCKVHALDLTSTSTSSLLGEKYSSNFPTTMAKSLR